MAKRKPMSKRDKNLKTVTKLIEGLKAKGVPITDIIADKTYEQHAHSTVTVNKLKGYVKSATFIHKEKKKKIEKIFGITDKYKADIIKHGGERSYELHVNQTQGFNQLLKYGTFDDKDLLTKSYEELLSIERQYKKTAKTGISMKNGREFVTDYFIRAEEENDLFLNTYFQHLQGVPQAIDMLEEIKEFSKNDLGMIKQIQALLDSDNFKGREYMEKGRSGYTNSDIYQLSMERLIRLHDMIKTADEYETDKNEKFTLIAKEYSSAGQSNSRFKGLDDKYDNQKLHADVIKAHVKNAQKQSKKRKRK